MAKRPNRPPLGPLIADWARVLHLADSWRITGRYVQHTDMGDKTTTGQVRRNRAQREAEIWILDPKLDRANNAERFDYNVEEDVIHELVHVIHTELEALIDEAKEHLPKELADNWYTRIDHENEVVINQMARVLKEVASSTIQPAK